MGVPRAVATEGVARMVSWTCCVRSQIPRPKMIGAPASSNPLYPVLPMLLKVPSVTALLGLESVTVRIVEISFGVGVYGNGSLCVAPFEMVTVDVESGNSPPVIETVAVTSKGTPWGI